MASGRSSKQDPQKTREAVAAISAWLDGEAPQPARALLADACRRTARTLAEELPGKTVELRVPPFVAVQCVDGPAHTRGTPPNVVEMGPETWLRVATGRSTFEAEVAAGAIDASGSRAEEIARGLPVIARS
ncbi:sterol carrier family protein [Corynebacterium sp. p3-SID1056]|uniref:sterol carrier family protein n=1 Tax=Corynebacterium sp. p3-SID1056 TaxID=2916092 RepID=UPI0021A677F2|nr:sterol carrier family protein [Corynebacterium sp. p3-SID1056]MCT2339681.1 sterol carrier family protein [Corynebacterium sp. p3-SID1056]